MVLNYPETILVVDDEPTIIELIKLQLEDTGFKIVGVTSGAEALDFLSKNASSVALVILDILMPGLSGYDVCRAIRSDARLKFIPVLVLSGLRSDQDRLHAQESGADDFLSKPCESELLTVRVRSLVRMGRLYVDLIERNRALEATIEKLKMAQGEMIQSEKYASLGNLLQGIIHELYNPLTIIAGNVDRINMRIARGNADQPFLEDVARSVKNAARRCVDIVDSLKMYYSDEKGQIEFADINDLIRRLVMVFEAKFVLRHNISIIQDYAENLPLVRCDRRAINKALMNILINAQESIGASGSVTVSTAFDGKDITIIVSDTGPGFTVESMERIFEPFFTTKKSGSNAGLGLPTTFGIIRSHGGEVSVINRSDGAGAVVTIRIPAGEDVTRPIEAANGSYEDAML